MRTGAGVDRAEPASLAATAGLAVAATQATRSAEHQGNTHSEYDAHRPGAIALQWGAGVAAVASVGLILGAALRYRAVARKRQLGAWFDGRGLGLALTGRF